MNRHNQAIQLTAWLLVVLIFWGRTESASAQTPPTAEQAEGPYAASPLLDALSPEQWRRVDRGVDRGLEWLAQQQQPDGSFPTRIGGQPAVTSLAVMAFLSKGHSPGAGPYGETINRAIDFVLKCQRSDSVFVLDKTNMPTTNWYRGSHTGMYNHAITGLMLGEVYGLTDSARGEKIREAISRALRVARDAQRRPGPHPEDKNAWRYFGTLNNPSKGEADLSVTGWFVMFYRSARNAEFDVPEHYVTEAAQFVRACYDERKQAFLYGPLRADRHVGRGMTGAGLLCLSLTGQLDNRMAQAAGDWILEHPFDQYNMPVGTHDRYHYGAYYCSQAMFLLGGEHWRKFYPQLANTLLNAQSPAGGWPPEGHRDGAFGTCYSSSLAILSLTPPYQLLPIYQR